MVAMSADTAPAAMPVVSHETASGETQQALCSTDATQAPAAMPGERGPDDAPCHLSAAEASAWASGFNAAHRAFAPILAEKEREIATFGSREAEWNEAIADSLQNEEDAHRKLEAAEAALAMAKEVSRQAVMAFFDELAARGVDQDMMADAMEAAADKSDADVAKARAAAIRAQGE